MHSLLNNMDFIHSTVPDVIIIKPKVFGDDRGFFMETFRSVSFSEVGIPTNFVQDNHSGSQRSTLRGLHYQIRHAQGKLFRVIVGEVYDVAVDLRRNSHTFAQWVGIHLSAENKQQLWIPQGFAHGFYVLSEWAEIVYKTTDYYAPQWERCLLWNDPDIRVEWPLLDEEPPLLSEKDLQGTPFNKADLYD